MTIEEKSKRYDEALERARVWKDKSGMPKNKQGILDDIFPELAGSEDEQIRKAIIEHFAESHSSMYPYKGFTKKQFLAWLEKQGEQKLTWSEDDEKMLVDAYVMLDWYKGNNWWTARRIKDWLKSLKTKVQPKQEWSEEDGKMINKLMAVVELYYVIDDDLDKQSCLSWLESFKQRIGG